MSGVAENIFGGKFQNIQKELICEVQIFPKGFQVLKSGQDERCGNHFEGGKRQSKSNFPECCTKQKVQ